jgi:hypothetical protein
LGDALALLWYRSVFGNMQDVLPYPDACTHEQHEEDQRDGSGSQVPLILGSEKLPDVAKKSQRSCAAARIEFEADLFVLPISSCNISSCNHT